MEELLYNVNPSYLHLLPDHLLNEVIKRKTITELIFEGPELRAFKKEEKGYWKSMIVKELKKYSELSRMIGTKAVVKKNISNITDYFNDWIIDDQYGDECHDIYLEYVYMRLAYIFLIDGKLTTLISQLHPYLIHSKPLIKNLCLRGFCTQIHREILKRNKLWDWWIYWESRSANEERKCNNREIFHIQSSIKNFMKKNNTDYFVNKRRGPLETSIKLYFSDDTSINPNNILHIPKKGEIISTILMYVIHIMFWNVIDVRQSYIDLTLLSLTTTTYDLQFNYNRKIQSQPIYGHILRGDSGPDEQRAIFIIYHKEHNIFFTDYYLFFLYMIQSDKKNGPKLMDILDLCDDLATYRHYYPPCLIKSERSTNYTNFLSNLKIQPDQIKNIYPIHSLHSFYEFNKTTSSTRTTKNNVITKIDIKPQHDGNLKTYYQMKLTELTNKETMFKQLNYKNSNQIPFYIKDRNQFDLLKPYRQDQSEIITELAEKIKDNKKALGKSKKYHHDNSKSYKKHVNSIKENIDKLTTELILKKSEIIFPLLAPQYSWWLDDVFDVDNDMAGVEKYFLHIDLLIYLLLPHFNVDKEKLKWLIDTVGSQKYGIQMEENGITNIPIDAMFFQFTCIIK